MNTNIIDEKKLRNALTSIGFSEADIDRHSEKIAQLIHIKLLDKILDRYPNDRKKILNQPTVFLNDHKNDKELLEIFSNIISEVAGKYFGVITNDLSNEQKENFYLAIGK